MKKALITGITGQDGSYLAELLLEKGYEVHGIVRRSSSINTKRIDHIFQEVHEKDLRLVLHYGDLTSASAVARIVNAIEPNEIYNMGAQSHVKVSFEIPEYTADVVILGTIRLLEVIRESQIPCRFYQASSSEMFGSAPPPQNERTEFRPRSPYGVAKAAAHWATVNYREAYGLHASTGILFNHESPRRGETFVTRKIAVAIPRIIKGEQRYLYLGNLSARRDWGHAREYMEAVHAMVQRDEPDDFVLGTGEDHSVQEFLEQAFGYVGLDWQEYVRVDARYERPCEVDRLCADASKALALLHWRPKVNFNQLVHEMVAAELVAQGLSERATTPLDRDTP